ncbi:hypothetical protein EDD86DRAFT_150409 [Gorgonomyces haynaldii]|nr:hypothetical protein EDD86DRAFT_150409 [Gorgonomyces haynaldii]
MNRQSCYAGKEIRVCMPSKIQLLLQCTKHWMCCLCEQSVHSLTLGLSQISDSSVRWWQCPQGRTLKPFDLQRCTTCRSFAVCSLKDCYPAFASILMTAVLFQFLGVNVDSLIANVTILITNAAHSMICTGWQQAATSPQHTCSSVREQVLSYSGFQLT